MTGSRTRRAIGFVGIFLGLALYFVLIEVHRPSQPAQDVYAYFLPNAVHAARSFWAGGRGLLWNPYQSCGEPFLANTVVGMFYPPHLAFLVFGPDTALHLVLIFNMLAGAIGMYLLCRELGLSPVAAVGGALVFELGDPMAQLTSWSPMHNAPWTWLPWALLFCERLLRRPRARDMVGLSVALALQLVGGFILVSVLTYQLIGLRVLWELATRWRSRPFAGAFAVTAGLICGGLLVAVQIIPAAELVSHSARITGAVLGKPMNLAALAERTGRRGPPVPFMAAPLMLAALGLLLPRLRRVALFFVLVGLFFAILALGDATPLLLWYVRLPFFGPTVRNHVRLFWVTGFCLALLTGFSLEVLRRQTTMSRWAAPVLLVLPATMLLLLTPGGLRWPEVIALIGIVALSLVGAQTTAAKESIAWAIVVLIVFNLAAVPLRWAGSLSWTSPLRDFAGAFVQIQPPFSPADRVLLDPTVGQIAQARFVQKTTTMLGVPGFLDYEALLTQRFEMYVNMLRATSKPGRHALMDLAALRIHIVSAGTRWIPSLGFERLPIDLPQIEMYNNRHALPRARFVPRVVVDDQSLILGRMANRREELDDVAYLEATPESGFLGDAQGSSNGSANFVVDDPEHIVLDVFAPQRGFVTLADQYFPGWEATVDGVATPILRANYLFRAVEVPAGPSRLEFVYRPRSVFVGAIISAGMAIVLAVVFIGGGPRSRRRHGLLRHDQNLSPGLAAEPTMVRSRA